MPLRAVIFDMDGVIVDTMDLHFEASEKVLGEKFKKARRQKDKVIYMTDSEAYKKLEGGKQEVEIEAMIRSKYDYLMSKTRGIKPIKGFFDFFFRVKGKYPLAVVSNSRRVFIMHVLSEIGEQGAFSVVVGEEDITAGKPDPQGYLKAAQALGVPPGECLVIEDGVYGVMAAKKAGMKVVAVTTTHERSFLQDADIIVDSLSQLTLEKCEALFRK